MRRRTSTLALVATLAAALASAAAARPAASPTLSASAKALGFGGSVTLRGTIPGASAGETVEIYAQPCGFTGPVPSGTAKTTAGGKFAYSIQPMLNVTFFAQVGDAKSASVPVRISPQVQLRRIAGGTFGIDVSAGNGSWFTKAVTLQRYDTQTKRWRPIASASLKANSDPGALISVSSATIHARIKPGTKIRAALAQSTVGSCFLPAASPAVIA